MVADSVVRYVEGDSVMINTEGDYVLSTSPGYVVLENMAKWLKGKIYHLPLIKENNFYPVLLNNMH